MNQQLPEFITKDQFRILYGQAQQQGMKDPGTLAKTLVDQGHVLEGLNDKNYKPGDQNDDQQIINTPEKKPGFIQSLIQGIAKPFTRLGVEAFNVGAGVNKAVHGDMAGAHAELDKSRNVGFLGETKPSLTNSRKVGVKEGLDIAGQGIELGVDFAGVGAGEQFVKNVGEQGTKQLIKTGAKTGAQLGGSAGFGSSLQDEKLGLFNTIKKTSGGAISGAILGGAIGGVTGFIKKLPWDGDPSAAANAYDKIVNVVTGDKTALGKKFAQEAVAMSEANPNLKMKLKAEELNTLQDLIKRKGVQLPEGIDSNELNPSQVQSLIKELDSHFDPRDPSNEVYTFARQIKAQAKSAFEKETQGAWSKMYSDFSTKINDIKNIGNMLTDPVKATPEQATKAQKALGQLANDPQGKARLKLDLENYFKATGHDLSDKTKILAQINQIKSSTVRTKMLTVLKDLGWATAGAVAGGGVISKVRGILGF